MFIPLRVDSRPNGRATPNRAASGPAGERVPMGSIKSHWGRRIALGAAGLLAAAGIGFGVDRAMNNGDDDPERGAVTDVTPVSEPNSTPTPEATPTKEPAKVEKSPYNFIWETKLGDTTIRFRR